MAPVIPDPREIKSFRTEAAFAAPRARKTFGTLGRSEPVRLDVPHQQHENAGWAREENRGAGRLYFRVPDINAATERIKAAGGMIANGPMEVPGGDWIVNAMDPQGAAFALHAKKAA